MIIERLVRINQREIYDERERERECVCDKRRLREMIIERLVRINQREIYDERERGRERESVCV